MILEICLFDSLLFPSYGDGCHTAFKNDKFISDISRINGYGFYLKLILHDRGFYISVTYPLPYLYDTKMQLVGKRKNFCTL